VAPYRAQLPAPWKNMHGSFVVGSTTDRKHVWVKFRVSVCGIVFFRMLSRSRLPKPI
jgi:hypothetical protein